MKGELTKLADATDGTSIHATMFPTNTPINHESISLHPLHPPHTHRLLTNHISDYFTLYTVTLTLSSKLFQNLTFEYLGPGQLFGTSRSE